MSGGRGHIGHKLNPDPLVGKNVALNESVWKAIDAIRGKQTTAAWIREAVANELYYEGKGKVTPA